MKSMVDYLQFMSIAIIIAGLAFGVLAALLFLYKMFMVWGLRKLEYKRYFSVKSAFEGDELYFIEEMTNRFFLPFRNIDVESNVPSGIKLWGCASGDDINQHFISTFTLMPFTRIKRTHKAKCMKRGHYVLETAKIEYVGEDVFIDSVNEFNVYPKEVPIEAGESLNMYLQYSGYSRYPLIQDVFSLSGIRKYEYGDAVNSINYKATAKASRLMVNSREYMLGRKVLVCVNFQMAEDSYIPIPKYEEYMENALSYAVYMLGECQRNGYMFGFCCNSRFSYGGRSEHYPMSAGKNAYMDILDIIACIRTAEGDSILPSLESYINENINGTEIFMFTLRMDEAVEKRLEELENMGNVINIIRLDEF